MLTFFSLAALAADADRDQVQDVDDLCPWSDDKIDLNHDGIADCAQSLIPGSPIDDLADVGFWTPMSGTFSDFDGFDLGAYRYSGSMAAEYYGLGSASVGHSICIPIGPPYGGNGTVGVWLQSTIDGAANATAVTELRQFTSANCSTGNVATGSLTYTAQPNAISVSSASSPLDTSTRSVMVLAYAATADTFLVDNVLVLRAVGSTGPGGDPSDQ